MRSQVSEARPGAPSVRGWTRFLRYEPPACLVGFLADVIAGGIVFGDDDGAAAGAGRLSHADLGGGTPDHLGVERPPRSGADEEDSLRASTVNSCKETLDRPWWDTGRRSWP
jgi:hypothetical protein